MRRKAISIIALFAIIFLFQGFAEDPDCNCLVLSDWYYGLPQDRKECYKDTPGPDKLCGYSDFCGPGYDICFELECNSPCYEIRP